MDDVHKRSIMVGVQQWKHSPLHWAFAGKAKASSFWTRRAVEEAIGETAASNLQSFPIGCCYPIKMILLQSLAFQRVLERCSCAVSTPTARTPTATLSLL
jgi:hypothetical protein